MNLTALRNFIAIVEAGSIREAADHLHIAQSALSRQVAGLERDFGAALLTRLPRGVEPTEAGRIVLRQARASLDQLRDARDEIAAFEGLRTGQIRIAAIEPFANGPLADRIARFRERHPGIAFEVRVGSTRQVVSLVREGVAELGVGYNPPTEEGVVVRAVARQPLVALVAPAHPLAGRDAVSLAEIAGFPAILPPAGSPTRLLIDEAARRAGVHLARIALESDSVALRLAIAARTDAVAVLARISADDPGASGRLVVLPLRDRLTGEGRLELLAAAGRPPTRAAAAFERLLRAALRASDVAEPPAA